MKTTILASALCAAFTVEAAAADITVDLGPIAGGADLDDAPHLSLGNVAAVNRTAAELALAMSDKLDLGQRSRLERAGYFLSAGMLTYHFQRATAIVHGHEGAHFHTAGLYGRTEHDFVQKDGTRISTGEALREAFRTGHVGGFAKSVSPDGDASTDDELMRANNAGLNWQSDYAERMLRQDFAFGGYSVFSAADYLLNRNYWARYAKSDVDKGRGPGEGGDPQDLAEHLEAQHGVEDALDKIQMWSAVSAVLSASNFQAMDAISSYVLHGKTGLFDKPYSWSISNYGYDDSFSVAPVFHGRVKNSSVTWFAGIETSVLGEGWTEATIGATRSWSDLNLEGSLTVAKDAGLLEIGIEKYLNDHAGLRAWAAVPVGGGETRRGMRLTPENEAVVSASLVLRF